MDDESAFLREILARPEDAAARMAYADWLEARRDARAQLLRMDPELGRLSYVAWLEVDGHLDYYLKQAGTRAGASAHDATAGQVTIW